jgi:putative thioredoxin
MSGWAFETNDADFKEAVIERSHRTPVVVDFWAPWCGPCRVLGPLLERLIDKHGGKVLLAKVNVDQNPGLASAFRVQSIPLLLGFRGGEVVAEAVGAVPEAEIESFLRRTMPSATDLQVATAEELLAAGKMHEAEPLLRQVIEAEPRHDRALLGLARAVADRGEDAEALQLLERVGPGSFRQDADRLAATLRVRQPAEGDVQALEQRVARAPEDLDSRMQLARQYAATSQLERALAQYLDVLRRNKEFDDGAARKAMLDIFEMLGPDSEVAERYRSELARTLFS